MIEKLAVTVWLTHSGKRLWWAGWKPQLSKVELANPDEPGVLSAISIIPGLSFGIVTDVRSRETGRLRTLDV
jgi:hypothetical protein